MILDLLVFFIKKLEKIFKKMNTKVSWKFYTSTESAWNAMLDSISKARETIDLEQYLFGSDNTIERTFVELLCKKSREGVKVRLLLDAVGSFYFYYSSLPRLLNEAGVEVLYHKIVLPRVVQRLIPVILRDHRKLLVVDGSVSHIGGVIIQESARGWRDTNVELYGSTVTDLQIMFEKAWAKSKKWKPLGPAVIENQYTKEFSVLGNSYHLKDKHLYKTILRMIGQAEKSIQITTPYFAPGKKFLKALHRAVERGVRVEILLPRRSDNIFADFIARWHYKSLLKHGVNLYLYQPRVLHQKTMVVDDVWASIGSSNFDWVSFQLDYELNIVSTNIDFVTELKQHFVYDLTKSEEVTMKKRR